MNLFAQLRRHARQTPEAVALFSRYRPITYRKLWSRIERATARLQGEWDVGSGDIVLYHGHAHPDALLLYLTLARTGAILLPLAPAAAASSALTHGAWQAAQAFLLQSAGRQVPRRLLVDDSDDALPVLQAPCSVSPLSALIATACPHQPRRLREEMEPASLAFCRVPAGPPAALSGEALMLFSAAGLLRQPALQPEGEEGMGRRLFDPAVLGGLVLPRLLAGESVLIA